MRKFLIPIINLVNVILVSIVFGISVNPSAFDTHTGSSVSVGNYYQLVWNPADKANVLGIVGFFLFVVVAAVMLFNFLPVKARKFTAAVAGAMFIGSGVLFLMTPASADLGKVVIDSLELSGSLIAMAVLVFVAGALSLAMAALDFTNKKAE